MIIFDNVSKSYHARGFHKHVFSNLSFVISRGDRLGILGANGAGKSTLMRLIAGVERPTGGRVHRSMTTSWPIGYASTFQVSLTGADNVRFIARIYGRDEREMLAYVEEFARLGPYFNQPVHTYSAGMTARLAFGVSLAVNFECYLIDEVTAAGDERFRDRTDEELASRARDGTLVMISHDSGTLARYCTKGAVLYGGLLVFYDSIEEAAETHQRLQHLPH